MAWRPTGRRGRNRATHSRQTATRSRAFAVVAARACAPRPRLLLNLSQVRIRPPYEIPGKEKVVCSRAPSSHLNGTRATRVPGRPGTALLGGRVDAGTQGARRVRAVVLQILHEIRQEGLQCR